MADATPETRRAVRFFWSTLIAATGASVAGNITHAVLAAPGHATIAATAAVVPRQCCSAQHTGPAATYLSEDGHLNAQVII